MPTIITRTIDASGNGDYTTFTAAEAAVSTIGTSADLVANDEAIVFECVAGTYTENVTFASSTPGPALTVDATRQVTYKPAAGSEHGGDPASGVICQGSLTIAGTEQFMLLDGLVVKLASGVGAPCVELGGDGNTVRSCLIEQQGARGAVRIGLVTAAGQADPVVLENCVIDASLSSSRSCIEIFGRTGGTFTDIVNCTGTAHPNKPFIESANADVTTKILNCLSLGTRSYTESSAATLTGSNNVGGATDPFPVALQAGSQTWTFTTDTDESTSPSTGSQVVYDATTGATLNVPGNDAVGEGTATGAPATDINGEDRIRDTHADPGAFTTQLRTITKSIDGSGGGDYTTFTAAEAAVSTLPTDADLVKRNEAIVFEAEAGTYVEGVTIDSSSPGPALTLDATRNVTYRAAAGSEHGGDDSAGARVVFNTSGSGGLNIVDDFTNIVGLVCTTGTGAVGNRGLIQANADGLLVEGCILKVAHSTPWCLWSNQGGATATNVYRNNVLRNANTRPISLYSIAAPTSHKFINNTIEGSGDRAVLYQVLGNSMTVEAVNNFTFNVNNWAQGNSSGGATFTTTGSGNVIDVVGSNMGAGVAILECTTSTNPADPSTGSLAIYDATTGALLNVPGNDAVGLGTSTGAPTTDINGEERIRGTYADPGAFVVPLRTITKSIDGAGGGDYTTFTAAEGAVVGLSANGNLQQRNETIVFEAEAGTYDGLIFSYSLTTDPTRNVTFRAAAGSEHGGVRGAGVVVQDNLAVTSYNLLAGLATSSTSHNLVLEGLEAHVRSGVTSSCTHVRYSRGVIFRNLLLNNEGTATTNILGSQGWGTATEPIVYENCVIHSSGVRGIDVENGSGSTSYAEIVNCTKVDTTAPFVFTGGSGTIDLLLLNNLSLSSEAYTNGGAGARNITGSNNVGGSTNPFPAALQAGGQTWTSTTDTTATSTGSQVIYDDETGRLYDVPGNDAWHFLTGLTGVPATDIEGETRLATGYNPGAFELTANLGVQATATGALFTVGGFAEALASDSLSGLGALNAPSATSSGTASSNAAGTASLAALRASGAAGMAMQAVAEAAMATPRTSAAAVVSMEALGAATLNAIGADVSAVVSLTAVGAAVLHSLQGQGLISLEVNGTAFATLSALEAAALGQVLIRPGPISEVTLTTDVLEAIVAPYIIIATDPNR